MYCLYKHTSPTGKVYIGVTAQIPEKRWKGGSGYVDNEYFTRAIKKYGWANFKHEILQEGLTKEEAEKAEREQIALYRSDERKFGYNIEAGGLLCENRSEYTRNKISNSLKGEKNPRYGKKFPNQMRRACARKSRFQLQEERIRRSQSHKGQVPVNKKKVAQYSKDGVLIEKFDTMSEAAEKTGVTLSNIGRNASGKRKSAGGYIWRLI